MKKLAAMVVIVTGCQLAKSQINDYHYPYRGDSGIKNERTSFPYQSFILPVVMIGYGATALHTPALQHLNRNVKELIWEDNPHKPMTIDNYLQFGPAAVVYGLGKQ